MHITAQDHKARLEAAYSLLIEDKTTIGKFEKIRTLVKGINPHIDKTLTSASDAIKKVKTLQSGEIIDLAAIGLPEETEEQKKRKKALLLFLNYWKDLQSEVKRAKSMYESANADGKITTKEHIQTAGKLASTSKGPFGLITALAVGIVAVGGAFAYLNTQSVTITIKNQGCSSLDPTVKLPVSIPGVKLPTESIPNGGQSTATLPPLTVNVDGSTNGMIKFTMFGLSMNYELSGATLLFDSQSLVGKQTTINLGTTKEHELIIRCSSVSL